MCIVAWHWQPQSEIPLIVVANRDEYHDRPTLSMHWWSYPPILAGKDLQAGGTWFAVNAMGHFAALTNFRSSHSENHFTRSRGEIIPNFFNSNLSSSLFLNNLSLCSSDFQPFNLLIFDGINFTGYESVRKKQILFSEGTHSFSNGTFNCQWPKTSLLRENLENLNKNKSNNNLLSDLLSILQDKTIFSEKILPETGLDKSTEKFLSSIFIQSNYYGTRSSTVFIKSSKSNFLFELIYNKYKITSLSHFIF